MYPEMHSLIDSSRMPRWGRTWKIRKSDKRNRDRRFIVPWREEAKRNHCHDPCLLHL